MVTYAAERKKHKGMWNEDAKDIRPLCNLYLRKS
jgi:hypothetical protein